MEPFGGKFIGFKNVEWANHIKFDTFTETVTRLQKHPDWKQLKQSDRFVEFEYLSIPVQGAYTLVLYGENEQVMQIFGKRHDDNLLTDIATFLNSVLH